MTTHDITLQELLTICREQNASDLHISPGLSPRLRVNGELIPLTDIKPLDAKHTKQLIYTAMDAQQIKTFENKLDLDFSLMLPSSANFRANVFHQVHGVAAVFRLIPERIPTLDQLRMPQVLKTLLNLPHGLVLVTGPTGSGKSTTLAAMIDHINTNNSSHIITIEDPVEFIHLSKKSLINQRQVKRDTQDFAIALRAALREDPDVILIGELRDLETIRLALTAAETGHLVLATLHTSSAPRTINRMVDVFPGGEKNMIRNMLAESLQGVISQTLIKNVKNTRTAALEIMLGTPAIRNLIREDKIAQMYSMMQTGKNAGMCTLDQCLQELIYQDVITIEEAEKAAIDKKYFSR